MSDAGTAPSAADAPAGTGTGTDTGTGTESPARPLPRTASAAVTEADLPESIARLIRTTVRRTRLRRRERRDVACELVSHFQSGLDAGGEPAALVAGFGRPRTAARLMRVAARRRRRRIDRAFTAALRWTGSAVAVALVVYAALAVRVASMEPVLSFDGYTRLRALVPQVPEADRAWPIYRAAIGWDRQTRLLEGEGAAAPLLAGRKQTMLREIDGEPDRRPAAAAELRAGAAELEQLRIAAAKPAFGWSIGPVLAATDERWFGGRGVESFADAPKTLTVHLPLPHLSELRAAAKLLAADTRVAAADGDGARAVADVSAILGVARHAGELPLVINQLVESSLVTMSAQETIRLLEHHADVLSDADLADLAEAFAGTGPAIRHLDLSGERIWFDDIVQHVFTDDGEGDGVLLVDEADRLHMSLSPGSRPGDFMHPAGRFASGPLVAGALAGRAETTALAHELYGLIEHQESVPLLRRTQPVSRRIEALAAAPLSGVRHVLIRMVVPAMDRAADGRAVAAMVAEATTVAIALERDRRRRGTWATALEQLVPDLLPAVPLDAYDGKPLRYAVDPVAGPRLWSVAEDGTDDGGAMSEHAFTGLPQRTPQPHHTGTDLVFLTHGVETH